MAPPERKALRSGSLYLRVELERPRVCTQSPNTRPKPFFTQKRGPSTKKDFQYSEVPSSLSHSQFHHLTSCETDAQRRCKGGFLRCGIHACFVDHRV